MGSTHSTNEEPARRQFFARIVKSIQSVIAGTRRRRAGGSILSPGFARREESWLPGPRARHLDDNAPTPATMRVAREDGYNQIVDRRVVFLVQDRRDRSHRARSTCTHLGCRVSWDAEAKELRCPCHGGTYDHRRHREVGPAARAAATAGHEARRRPDSRPDLMRCRIRCSTGSTRVRAGAPAASTCSKSRSRPAWAGGS